MPLGMFVHGEIAFCQNYRDDDDIKLNYFLYTYTQIK